MGLSDWLFGSTPGQQAGQAVKEVVSGVFDGIDKIIDNFHLEPEKALQAKIALAEHKLKSYEIMLNDVQNARLMQMQTKSVWPGFLSLIIVCGFFGGSIYVLVSGVPKDLDDLGKQIINMNSVALISGLSAVIGYWLGSSNSSQEKNQMLYHSTPSKKE